MRAWGLVTTGHNESQWVTSGQQTIEIVSQWVTSGQQTIEIVSRMVTTNAQLFKVPSGHNGAEGAQANVHALVVTIRNAISMV